MQGTPLHLGLSEIQQKKKVYECVKRQAPSEESIRNRDTITVTLRRQSRKPRDPHVGLESRVTSVTSVTGLVTSKEGLDRSWTSSVCIDKRSVKSKVYELQSEPFI